MSIQTIVMTSQSGLLFFVHRFDLNGVSRFDVLREFGFVRGEMVAKFARTFLPHADGSVFGRNLDSGRTRDDAGLENNRIGV